MGSRSRLSLALAALGVLFCHSGARADGVADATPILDRLRAVYAPLARQAGGVLTIEIDSDSPLVVASARRDTAAQFQVIIDVGLLRSPRLTADSLRITACHELGHLFGGAPLRPLPPEWNGPSDSSGLSLLSAEGQADYYATQVCFREIVRGENHLAALSGRAVPASAVAECDAAWRGDVEGALICRRAALASLEFLNMVKDFPISLDRRDSSVVQKTVIAEYPGRQCRLDTLIAGATCARRMGTACNGTPAGRPSCWYAN